MLIFKRKIEDKIAERMFKGRAILIFGPRQAGKTTLSKKILQTHNHEKAYFNCDLAVVRNNFELGRPDLLKEMVGENRIAVFPDHFFKQIRSSQLKVITNDCQITVEVRFFVIMSL